MTINAESVAALGRLLIGIIVSLVAAIGIDLDKELLENILWGVIALAMLIYIWWWKNQNLTKASQEAQKVLDLFKSDKNDWITTITWKDPNNPQIRVTYPEDGKNDGEEL